MRVFSWDDIRKIKAADFPAAFTCEKAAAVGVGSREVSLGDYSGVVGTALTVGGFDGPHRGHAVLCRKIIETARKRNLIAGVITFTRSPRLFKQNSEYAGDISTLRLRLEVFKQWGFDFAVVIDFSPDFSRIEGSEFLRILKDCCAMRFFGVGKGFHCGRDHAVGEVGIRSFAEAYRIGCDFVALESVLGSRVSSTLIRRYIATGQFEKVSRFLGRFFELDCRQFNVRERSGTQLVLESCAEKLFQVLPAAGMYRVDVSASVSENKLRFCTDLYADASVLRLEVPDANKEYRFDVIRFLSQRF